MKNRMSFTRLFSLMMVPLSFVLLSAQTVSAQAYPTKPVELYHHHSPGGAYDLVARIIAKIAPKYFPQPIVVVSKPGSSVISAAEIVNAPPDGHRLLMTGHGFFATTIWTLKMPYDPEDLIPLANFIEISRPGLLVRSDSPFKTFDDLIAHGKKNPGQLRWGHPGYAHFHVMGTYLIFKRAGIKTIDVPFKGTPEALAALLGGHVDAGPFVHGMVTEQLKAGKVRYLLMYSEKRYKDQQDVPTSVEKGYTEPALLGAYTGLYVHRKTPPAIVKTLTDLCKKIYDDPEYVPAVEKIGQDPLYGDAEFLKKMIKKQAEIGIPILKELGLYVPK